MTPQLYVDVSNIFVIGMFIHALSVFLTSAGGFGSALSPFVQQYIAIQVFQSRYPVLLRL